MKATTFRPVKMPSVEQILDAMSQPRPQPDMNQRRKLEDALDSIGANHWMRTTARRVLKGAGIDHALDTVKAWEG